MSSILEAREIRDQLERLARANNEFAAAYPGDPTDRQPVHTVYGGGHLFTHDVVRRLGAADEVWVAAVNGVVVALTTPLQAGDVLCCFESIHGG